MKKSFLTVIFVVGVLLPINLQSQQVADTTFNPIIEKPLYKKGQGSVVFIDEAHNNFHTKDGRYKAFSILLERDGYQVKSFKDNFTEDKLKQGKILVISNALHKSNIQRWILPNPSAFSDEEIKALKNWVKNGGSLFLIADHMPMAGAAEDLAKVFGFKFTNGFAMSTSSRGPSFFNLKDKTLVKSKLTQGRDTTESVRQIASFTGQAFKIPEDATSILKFDKSYVNLLPDTAWVFSGKTKQYFVEGWSQGAYKKYGKGKLVVFGEAAMFSAQLAGPNKRKMGMNNEVAPENYKLLLNIIHWLDDQLH